MNTCNTAVTLKPDTSTTHFHPDKHGHLSYIANIIATLSEPSYFSSPAELYFATYDSSTSIFFMYVIPYVSSACYAASL